MKTLWSFFSSVRLTVALAVLICADAAWGSIVTIRNPGFFRALDQSVLLAALSSPWAREPGVTLWIYVLVLLVFLFTVNSAVCTADRVYSIARLKRPLSALYPHVVHAGFLIAVAGHLAGSVSGFRTYGNVALEGALMPVPRAEGVQLRLDAIEMDPAPDNGIPSPRTAVTLFEDGAEARRGVIRMNAPLIYRGIAFYHADQGTTPTGLVLEAGGRRIELGFGAEAWLDAGRAIRLGRIFPDFAVNEAGAPYSRSGEFRNPHIEVVSGNATAYLDVSRPGSRAALNGMEVRLVDYVKTRYAVLTINRDPGIWLIIAGSTVLVIGMLLLLFLRGERGEIIKHRV
jgi:cytochrome c biogenesis protein